MSFRKVTGITAAAATLAAGCGVSGETMLSSQDIAPVAVVDSNGNDIETLANQITVTDGMLGHTDIYPVSETVRDNNSDYVAETDKSEKNTVAQQEFLEQSSNLPPGFIEQSFIKTYCEAVFIDIPNDIVLERDTTLSALVVQIPEEEADDRLLQEQFTVAGTTFENDFYFDNLEAGGNFSISLDATVGVIGENIISLVVGGIEACEDEGDSDSSITSINGGAEVSPGAVAERGSRIKSED
jgi:hypothetical protein